MTSLKAGSSVRAKRSDKATCFEEAVCLAVSWDMVKSKHTTEVARALEARFKTSFPVREARVLTTPCLLVALRC
jgi:hypothetical protein